MASVAPERMLIIEDSPEKTLEAEETLTIPEILPGFSAQVKRFFE